MADSDGILWSPSTNMNVVDTWDALNPKREPNNELDKDAFLRLLMTQMQNQDPLNPMDDQQFLGQMAQFTQLEQMVNLNKAYSSSQAYAMLGKQVEGVYTNPDTEEKTETGGTVVAVTNKAGEVYLTLDNEYEIPLNSVTAVGDEYVTNTLLDSIASDASNARTQDMVGKRIQAIIQEDGKITGYVEGVVDYVKFSGYDSILMVGNKEVLPYEVVSVASASGDSAGENPFLIGRTIKVRTAGDGGTSDEAVAITDVLIKNEKATLQVINGEGEMSEVSIEKINYIMEAMSYKGKAINYESFVGTVEDVVVTNGVPHLQVRNADGELSELSYKTFINEETE